MYDVKTTVAISTATTNVTACPITMNVTYQMMMDTGYTMLPTPLGSSMPYQGMWRDWLAASFSASLCMFFGSLWLYKELALCAFVLCLVILPPWTAGIIYIRYNNPYSSLFTTWWYFAVLVAQFFVGFACMYLYAWVKAELEARAREEEIKSVVGKIRQPKN